MRRRGWLVGMLLLVSCTAKRPETVMAPEPGPDFPEVPVSFQVLPPQARWWESFDDPGLTEQVVRALHHNPAALQALSRLKRAQAVLGGEAAARGPKLDAELAVGRSRLVSQKDRETASIGLGVAYEVDFWGRLEGAEDKARFLAQASEADLASLYLSLAAEVGTLYFQRQADILRLDLLEEKRRVAVEFLTWTRQRYEKGLITLSEQIQAETGLLALDAASAEAGAALRVREHALHVLTGLAPGSRLDTGKGLPQDPPLLYGDGLSSELVRQRPDVHAAWLRVEAADRDVAMAVAERFPRFQLRADAAQAIEDTAGQFFSGGVWNIGVSLTAPLLDWGRRKALVKARQAALEGAVEAWRETVLTGLREMADALVRNAAQDRVLTARRQQQMQSDRDLERICLRYEEGIAEYRELLVARTRSLEAADAVVQAELERVRQRITLARSVGGSWTAGILDSVLQEEEMALSGSQQ